MRHCIAVVPASSAGQAHLFPVQHGRPQDGLHKVYPRLARHDMPWLQRLRDGVAAAVHVVDVEAQEMAQSCVCHGASCRQQQTVACADSGHSLCTGADPTTRTTNLKTCDVLIGPILDEYTTISLRESKTFASTPFLRANHGGLLVGPAPVSTTSCLIYESGDAKSY